MEADITRDPLALEQYVPTDRAVGGGTEPKVHLFCGISQLTEAILSRTHVGLGLKLYLACFCGCVLTLAVLGEDAGGDAADVLFADARVLNLHLYIWQRHHVEVALVGQDHQAAFAVVLRPTAAEPGHAHPPHSGAIYGCQLQLHLSANLWQGENLETQPQFGETVT